MFRNYFKIAWRNIKNHSLYSAINILGLFAGILFSLLIATYVWGEVQVNRTLKNASQQYFLESEWKEPNMGVDFTSLGPLAKRLKEDYPSLVANYYRWDGFSSIISKEGKNFRENIQMGDSTLLSMYGFKLLHGNSKTALTNPYSLVITTEKAIKYFGKTDVVGETLTVQNFSGDKHEFSITGVLKEISKNSVTEMNENNHNTLFISFDTASYFGRTTFDSWSNIYIPSYIELKQGVSITDLEIPIQKLIAQNTSDRIIQNLKVKPIALTNYYLQKDNGLVNRMIYTLGFVGLFILLMAIVNFVNIAISMSGTRMKEIGIRKVLGGVQTQLIFQFLIESFIMVLLATALAVSLFPILSPLFNQLVGTEIPELSSFSFYYIFVLIGLIFIVSLLAGLYPAFVLSSLKSIDSLKGKLKTKNVSFHKSLVAFQFSIALVVLICAFIVTQQVNHFFGQDLGYNKEFILSAQVPRDWSPEGVQKMKTIRNEFETMPQITSASLSFEILNGNYGGQSSIYRVGTNSNESITMRSLSIDQNYFTTYEIPLSIASDLNINNQIDSTKVVLNEKAVLALGWKNAEEAIGQKLRIPNIDIIYTIQNVTTDFHFGSMHEQIQPIIFFNVNTFNIYRYLSFKVKPGNIQSDISAIQKKWAELLPGSSFDYSFMDETLKKLYASEIQLKKSAYNASLLSLIIVLLGVIGLISLSVHKRIKEIGLRKVLGASILKIIILFIKEFLSVILIASIIAIPIAYFIMKGWLNNYAYRINITLQPFVFSIVTLAVITLLMIGLLTYKVANTNPAESLKTE